MTRYHRRLFFFLSVASFFEGYDCLALSQVLPNLRAALAPDEAPGGRIVSVIGIGTILAYAVVRQADRWGRRRVLMLAILGYATFTFLTGFSRGVVDFTLFQLAARRHHFARVPAHRPRMANHGQRRGERRAVHRKGRPHAPERRDHFGIRHQAAQPQPGQPRRRDGGGRGRVARAQPSR